MSAEALAKADMREGPSTTPAGRSRPTPMFCIALTSHDDHQKGVCFPIERCWRTGIVPDPSKFSCSRSPSAYARSHFQKSITTRT